MNKPINEHVILIYGKANVVGEPQSTESGEVILLVKGNIKKVEDVDNEDGTMDRLYKIKQIDTQVCPPKNQSTEN